MQKVQLKYYPKYANQVKFWSYVLNCLYQIFVGQPYCNHRKTISLVPFMLIILNYIFYFIRLIAGLAIIVTSNNRIKEKVSKIR